MSQPFDINALRAKFQSTYKKYEPGKVEEEQKQDDHSDQLTDDQIRAEIERLREREKELQAQLDALSKSLRWDCDAQGTRSSGDILQWTTNQLQPRYIQT